jgi:hypothetical protein
MYGDYKEYLYNPCANIIDYETAIINWVYPNINIQFSRENIVELAHNSKRIKNIFTLANFNNNHLNEKLTSIFTKVDSKFL